MVSSLSTSAVSDTMGDVDILSYYDQEVPIRNCVRLWDRPVSASRPSPHDVVPKIPSVSSFSAPSTLYVFVRDGNPAECWWTSRGRSPYLVLVNGVSLLIGNGVLTYLAAYVLYQDLPLKIYYVYMVFYFFLFSFWASWMSRIARLGLAYASWARKRAPWLKILLRESILVGLSVIVGIASTSIPFRTMFEVSGPFAWVEFWDIQRFELWVCQVVLLITGVILVPIVWRVDDLFSISQELIAVLFLQFLNTVVVILADRHGDHYLKSWINEENIPFVAVIFMFGLSVVDPIRRLAFDPLAKRYPSMVTAQSNRQRRGLRTLKRTTTAATEPESFPRNHGSGEASEVNTPRKEVWSYERLAAEPALSTEFRRFAFRALCQESVLFLEEVSKFQEGDYSCALPSLPLLQADCQQATAFLTIVERFIAEGSPEEINISGIDRRSLLELSRNEGEGFLGLEPEHKRLVFGEAYIEIRYVLETNLVRRFAETQEFRNLVTVTPEPPMRRRRRHRRSDAIAIDRQESDVESQHHSERVQLEANRSETESGPRQTPLI